jgi:hypothetical protein
MENDLADSPLPAPGEKFFFLTAVCNTVVGPKHKRLHHVQLTKCNVQSNGGKM